MDGTGLQPLSSDLHGRRALVTGASRGIGAAIAVALARAGADVAICARSEEGLAGVAERIEAFGRRAAAIPCDVTERDHVAACVERAWNAIGPLDVLVNNAGGPLFQAPFLDVREDGWQRLLDLNLTSTFRFCQRVGGRMVERQTGTIINMASLLAPTGWPAIAGYSAAKAAVLQLTRSLAVEWGEAGIRVNAICPGWIRTDLNRVYLEDGERAAAAIEAAPLGRWGEAAEVAAVAVWLASDAARYVTGAAIPVDGGLAVGLSGQWQRTMRADERRLAHD